ncbi:MAG: hypothetical protein ACRCX2_22540 [Paraclostridium sp.]
MKMRSETRNAILGAVAGLITIGLGTFGVYQAMNSDDDLEDEMIDIDEDDIEYELEGSNNYEDDNYSSDEEE